MVIQGTPRDGICASDSARALEWPLGIRMGGGAGARAGAAGLGERSGDLDAEALLTLTLIGSGVDLNLRNDEIKYNIGTPTFMLHVLYPTAENCIRQ